jgi:tRNA(Ile)-lysidine synthase
VQTFKPHQNRHMNLQLPPARTLILGVSGGMDSMVLAHLLKTQHHGTKLIGAHLDHGLRSDSSEDATFVKKTLAQWDIPCEIKTLTPPEKGNLEDWGRKERYAFFEELRIRENADFIVTAHHQNDDLESFFLHLLRGTRVKGMSGMQALTGHLLRPLLFTPRSEIESHATAHKIPYREDPSNADLSLKRNFLRHKILPELEKIWPDFMARWQSQKNYWLELQKWMGSESQNFLNENLSEQGLSRQAYKILPLPLRHSVLEAWFQQSTGERISDSATLLRWDDAISNWPSGKKTEWHGNMFLELKPTHARLAINKKRPTIETNP